MLAERPNFASAEVYAYRGLLTDFSRYIFLTVHALWFGNLVKFVQANDPGLRPSYIVVSSNKQPVDRLVHIFADITCGKLEVMIFRFAGVVTFLTS